jgi:8-oxo-dGTP pyrophosphatase MutT (NUDIX family)
MKEHLSVYLKQQIEAGLPGREAHFEMSHKLRTYTPDTPSAAMESAVCILLFPNEKGSFSFTLMERTSHNKNDKHKGQISLPGGKKDNTDIDLSKTALREVKEEIGVSEKEIELIGQLTELYIPVSNFVVYPFIGFSTKKPIYQKQESEVKDIFEVELNALMDSRSVKHTNIKISKHITLKDVPYFNLENKVVWGATAMILNELKSIVKEYI